jgi:hypothetical protein
VVVDSECYKMDKRKDGNLINDIGAHIKKHVKSLDNRGILGNIFFDPDNRIIYVIDN